MQPKGHLIGSGGGCGGNKVGLELGESVVKSITSFGILVFFDMGFWTLVVDFVLEVLVVLVLDEYFFLFVDENLDQALAIAMLEFPLYFWFDFNDFRHECASVNLCLRQNSSRQVSQRYLFEGPSISLHEE